MIDYSTAGNRRTRGTAAGFCAWLVALVLTGGFAAEAVAQSSRDQVSSADRQVPSVTVKDDPAAAQRKAEGRNAAVRLCRDFTTYTNMSRSPGAVTDSQPLFSSLQPLCPTGSPTVRIQKYDCAGQSGSIHGNCADSWWDALVNGLSWCSDMKFMCVAMGGTWSSRV
ncbi:MAG: hypothetical protein H6Q02_47 [Acidobacteria bacterium]|jgi:hypothetical protein|nr:hypothetical protein [Acidobacteriota bacterium]